MSELVTEHSPQEFIVAHRPTAVGEVSSWVCLDDRPVAEEAGLGLYKQWAGGAHGAATDALVAAELVRKGSLLEIDASGAYMPDTWTHTKIHEVAPVLSEEATKGLVSLNLHMGCAAEDNALPVATRIINPAYHLDIFRTAVEFLPDFTSSEFENTVLVYEAMLAQGAIADKDVAAAAMTEIRRVPLLPMQHVAGTILSNHVPATAFDSTAALEAGMPAYHASLGDVHEIADPASEILGVTARGFTRKMLAATAVRHAAIALILPRPHGPEVPLTIQRVGA